MENNPSKDTEPISSLSFPEAVPQTGLAKEIYVAGFLDGMSYSVSCIKNETGFDAQIQAEKGYQRIKEAIEAALEHWEAYRL